MGQLCDRLIIRQYILLISLSVEKKHESSVVSSMKKKKKNIKCYIKFGDESFCEIKQNISIFEFKKRIFLKIASQNTSHTSNKKSYPIDLLKLINTISILRYYNRIISSLVVEINVKNVHETFRSFICFPPRDTTL